MTSTVRQHSARQLWRVRAEAELYPGGTRSCGAVCGTDHGQPGAELGCLQSAEADVGRQDGLQAMTDAGLLWALHARYATEHSRAEPMLPRFRRLGWEPDEAHVLAVLWANTTDPVLAERLGAQAEALIDELGLPAPDSDGLSHRAIDIVTVLGTGVPNAQQWLAKRGPA